MSKYSEKNRKAYKDLGGPAFPQVHADCPWEGLSRRDYFAAQGAIGFMMSLNLHDQGWPTPDKLAQYAFHFADCMIEESRRIPPSSTETEGPNE